MNQHLNIPILPKLKNIIESIESNITFNMLEIGSLDINQPEDPFYQLLDLFPGSKLIGFEVNEEDCRKMNNEARPGAEFYPVALGEKNEIRKFYITEHQMCCSLYEPDESLNSLYQNLHYMNLKSITDIKTSNLNTFVKENNIGIVDFIKIDIQGAELDVFKGGVETIKNVVAIVSEVEFIAQYKDQPLFGDICQYLQQSDLMFHKFLGLAGRALKPMVINRDINFPGQHMFTDAMFIRQIQKLNDLSDHQILKLGLLACAYGSLDVTHYCLAKFDKRKGSKFTEMFMKELASCC